MQQIDICGISRNFSRLSRCYGQVAYALLTRAPVAARELPRCAAPRLACVKPVASVHPEPGSNSPLLFIFFFYFSLIKTQTVVSRPMVASWRGLPPPVLILSHCRIISMSFVLIRASVALPRRTSPFWRCECKGTANPLTHQTFLQLFCVKKHIFL